MIFKSAMPDLDPYHLLEDINWSRRVKLIRSRPSELKTIWLPQTRSAIDSSDKRRYVELLGWHSCVSNDHIRSEVCPPDGLEDCELCWCVDLKGNGLHMAKWGHQEEALCIFPLSCLNIYNFRLKTSFFQMASNLIQALNWNAEKQLISVCGLGLDVLYPDSIFFFLLEHHVFPTWRL